MPLGIFGGGGSNGPKPQPLTSEKKEKRDKGSGSGAGLLDLKDSKGTTIKLGKKSYTVEKKLAEGGFALVYLVCDKHNRNYALKRQLIRDDPRQIEACRTECQIVKNLNGHKNIVSYVDHQLSVNKVGIYDYMLLTVYYPTNVLQLMNSRLLSNRWLSSSEILDIFCDICEAVARLHHSKTPVIHRDLKIENVLIDQRTGSEKPVYVLCDFGSATTKVLSKETHNQAYMEEEIRRYTTLSYRAPEMIDLFSGVPISTKSDIWALGVTLYKICYFSLPFGESALAIQNGTFTFPDQPDIAEEIKAIINLLLTSSARHRPNIFQTSYLAFAAANRKCPVFNIEKSPRIELSEAVQILRLRAKLGANYSRLFEKAFNDFENAKKQQQSSTHANSSGGGFAQMQIQPETSNHGENFTDAANKLEGENPIYEDSRHNHHQQQQQQYSSSSLSSGAAGKSESLVSPPVEGVIVNTSVAGPRSSTTSVNPRLRPKAANSSNILSSPFGVVPPMSARQSTSTPVPTTTISSATPLKTTLPRDTAILPQHNQNTSTTMTTNVRAETITPRPAPTNVSSADSSAVIRNSENQNEGPSRFSAVDAKFHSLAPSSNSTSSPPPLLSSGTAKSSYGIDAPAPSAISLSHQTKAATLPATNSNGNGANNSGSGGMASGDSSGTNTISSCLKSSAFQPYTIIASKQKQRKLGDNTPTPAEMPPSFNDAQSSQPTEPSTSNAIAFESSNPFISASAGGAVGFISANSPPTMDDNAFGERFDELRRVNRRNTIEATMTSTNIFAPSSQLHHAQNANFSAASENQNRDQQLFPAKAPIHHHSTAPPPQKQLQRTVTDGCVPRTQQQNIFNAKNVHQQQQEAFLAAQKLRFVPARNFASGAPPTESDTNWLERAIEEDPFGRAPSLPPHQMATLVPTQQQRQHNNENAKFKLSLMRGFGNQK